jgi:DNA-binding response OmpR family regulator
MEMGKRILLLEPYDVVADVITEVLDQLDYEADVVASGRLDENDLRARNYDCVLINLGQNRTEWREYGLRLAELASALGIPVMMIADHQVAAS